VAGTCLPYNYYLLSYNYNYLLCLVTCLVSRQSSNAYASSNASDIRAGLKDLLRGKKSYEPVKSELEEYLNEPLDDVSLDDEYDILS
jgi:hypothetical protein